MCIFIAYSYLSTSIFLSVDRSIDPQLTIYCMHLYLFISSSIYLYVSICLSFCLSRSIHLSILSIYLSVYLCPRCLGARRPVYLGRSIEGVLRHRGARELQLLFRQGYVCISIVDSYLYLSIDRSIDRSINRSIYI